MTINKKNFRSTLVALAFGALVTVLPASADTISLAVAGSPSNILVGGYSWTFAGGTLATTTLTSAGITLNGNSMSTEFGAFSSTGNGNASALQSQVIDFTVTPTVNGGAAAAVTFQGTLQESTGGVYSLYFGGNGTTGCTNVAVSCATTSFGNVVNNGQTLAANGYTLLSANGLNYEVQTSTILSPTKGTFVNGFIGVVTAPEPATYATTGLAAAFLGLFLRRKKQNS